MKKLLVSITVSICALLAIFMHPSASYGANEGGAPSPSAVSIRTTTTSMPTWTKTLFAKKSTVYNNRLALKAAEMCNSSYGISNKGIKAKFDEYGLDDYKPYNYRLNYYRDGGFVPGDNTAAFMVGHDTLKINGSNAIVLVVVMRGTQTIREQVGDWGKGGEKAFLGTKVWNNVNDFYRSVNDGVDEYVKSHGRIIRAAKSGKLRVLITGHSLGGAAANMYAARLNHSASKRVPGWKGFLKKGDIYAYTFGAIKVLTRNVNIAYGYENIHNIYNKYDSFGPNGAKSRFKASHPKAKFGHTDIFDIGKKDESSVNLLGNPNHDVTTYIEALSSGKVSCSSSTYKVTFNGNVIGGTKSSSQTIRWGKTTKLKANNFKALGYKFIGWNTKPNGKGKSYGNKSNVKNLAKPYDSIVLFAQWKKVPTIKVVFSANGGKGTMKAQVFNRGESVALKANTFKRAGYKFVGWNTKANGKGKAFKNKQKVKNLITAGKTVKLYAQWKKVFAPLTKSEAEKAYTSILKEMSKSSSRIRYCFEDVVGDEALELVAMCYLYKSGWSTRQVYEFVLGKPRLVLSDGGFGPYPNHIYSFKLNANKEMGLLVFRHYSADFDGGYDSHEYYKFSGGKYRAFARKTHTFSSSSTDWSYRIWDGGKEKVVTKASFNRRLSSLIKGEKTVGWYSWRTLEGSLEFKSPRSLRVGSNGVVTGVLVRVEDDYVLGSSSSSNQASSAVRYVVLSDSMRYPEGGFWPLTRVLVGCVQSGYRLGNAHKRPADLRIPSLDRLVGNRVQVEGTLATWNDHESLGFLNTRFDVRYQLKQPLCKALS